jgi:hypothetical protein
MSGVNLTIANQPLVLNISGDMGDIILSIPQTSLSLVISNSGTQGIQGPQGEPPHSGDLKAAIGSGIEVVEGSDAVLKDGVTIGVNSGYHLPTQADKTAWNEAVQDIAASEILFAERNSTGLISGGLLVAEGGIAFTVQAGVGQLVNHLTNIAKKIVWDTQIHISTTADGVNYFGIDTDGIVRVFLADPDRNNYIYIGACVATQGNTVIIDYQNNPEWIDNFQSRVTGLAGFTIKPLIETGCEVTSPTALGISVAEGIINSRLNRTPWTPVGNLTKVFGTSNYGFVPDTYNSYSPANKVNTTHWNDFSKGYGSSMILMTDGYWKKDLVAIFNNGSVFYVYGQAEYLTESLAKQAPMQFIPGTISTAAIYLAFIVSRKGDTDISNRLQDIRPNFQRVWGLLGNNADTNHINEAVNIMSTGLLNGGILSINADPTKFNLTGGNAIFVDNTDPLNPIKTALNWGVQTGIIDTLIATCDTTYVRMNNLGVFVLSPIPLTEELRRDYVEIGWLDHPNRTSITFARTEPFYNSGIQSQFNDFVEARGPFNMEGNVYSPASTDLTIKRNEGHIFDGNSNYPTNAKDPNTIRTLEENPCEIFYYNRLDLIGNWKNDNAGVQNIDPDHYDDGSGTLADVPLGKWTIQHIMFYPIYESNDIQYGQTVYDTYAKALAGLYDQIEVNPYNHDDVFRCWLLVKQGTSDLSNLSFAKFISAGRIAINDIISGAGGGSVGAEEIVDVNSEIEETAAFSAGAKIVIRLDLL